MRFFLSAAACAVLSVPLLAHAEPMVLFTITGPGLIVDYNGDLGNLDLTFAFPEAPTNLNIPYPGGGFGFADSFPIQRNGFTYPGTGVYFYSAGSGGGFTLNLGGVYGEASGFDFGGGSGV